MVISSLLFSSLVAFAEIPRNADPDVYFDDIGKTNSLRQYIDERGRSAGSGNFSTGIISLPIGSGDDPKVVDQVLGRTDLAGVEDIAEGLLT